MLPSFTTSITRIRPDVIRPYSYKNGVYGGDNCTITVTGGIAKRKPCHKNTGNNPFSNKEKNEDEEGSRRADNTTTNKQNVPSLKNMVGLVVQCTNIYRHA